MDSDGDGETSVDECSTLWIARFSALDRNNDSSITKNEINDKIVEWFSRNDMDGDGFITVVEYTENWVGKDQAEELRRELTDSQ
jgi:Ca2+-binding EF-hand superfamily protein